jgi:membrane protease YdiL (CAAX protease family)
LLTLVVCCGTFFMKIPIVDDFLQLFRSSNLRPTLIMLMSVVVIVTWKTAGSQDFFHNHVAGLVQFGDPVNAAAWYQMGMALLLLGILPACLMRFAFGEPLARVGLGKGSPPAALALFALATPFIVWISHTFAAHAEFREVYPLNRGACHSGTTTFAAHVASLGLFYLGWEFHFRGFLQQALGASLSPAAGLWVQVLASTLLHFGRPDVELWASIPASILWGLQANYSGAIWAGFAQHWLLGATLDYFICFA